jgi:hypothetical protein
MMLMANKKIVYNGPAVDTMAFFEKAGYPVPPNSNPTEIYLSYLTKEYVYEKKPEESFEERFSNIMTVYDSSEMHSGEPSKDLPKLEHKSKGMQGVSLRFKLLFLRSFKNSIRNPMLMKFSLMSCVAMVAIV